jgi:hypothetical protein
MYEKDFYIRIWDYFYYLYRTSGSGLVGSYQCLGEELDLSAPKIGCYMLQSGV